MKFGETSPRHGALLSIIFSICYVDFGRAEDEPMEGRDGPILRARGVLDARPPVVLKPSGGIRLVD